MFVNLTDVLTNQGKVLPMQIETGIKQVLVGGESYQVLKSVPVDFVFTNTQKGRARIEGKTEFTFAVTCDRCLKPVEQKIALVFTREVTAPDMSTVRPRKMNRISWMDTS